MSFIKNKILYVLEENTNNHVGFNTVDNEVFLTADLIEGLFSFEDYQKAIRAKLCKHISRLYILNEDETIKKDISEYVISCSVDLNHQQGQTRSINVTLMNFNKEFLPSPVKGRIWKGIKFRLDLGLFYNKTVYWKQCGIFTPNDPTLNNSGSNKTISIQMYDKFALLDGTLGGKTDIEFKIPVGTTVRQAIQMCLSANKGNGKQYDYKPVIFPSKHDSRITPFTLTKTSNSSIGEIIIDLANMISCDVYYNENGNLTLTSGIDDVFMENKPIQWNYSNKELLYSDSSMTVDFSKVVNKIIVKGAIVNGKQYKGIATNTNPNSQSNIYMTEINPELIEDKNINSDQYCLDRAKYELKNKSMIGFQVKFKSIFIPHLIHNSLVMWSTKDYNFSNEKFIIQNIHIEQNTDMLMDISMTNIKELALIG